RTVKRHRRANPRNDSVEAFELFTAIVNTRVAGGNVHVAAQRVNHLNLVAFLLCGFYEPACGVQLGFAGKNTDFHARIPETSAPAVRSRKSRTRFTYDKRM